MNGKSMYYGSKCTCNVYMFWSLKSEGIYCKRSGCCSFYHRYQLKSFLELYMGFLSSSVSLIFCLLGHWFVCVWTLSPGKEAQGRMTALNWSKYSCHSSSIQILMCDCCQMLTNLEERRHLLLRSHNGEVMLNWCTWVGKLFRQNATFSTCVPHMAAVKVGLPSAVHLCCSQVVDHCDVNRPTSVQCAHMTQRYLH